MAFCEKDSQLAANGYTSVDNKFFINYLPDAPDMRSAVYLLGLALADSAGEDNSVETICAKLNITQEAAVDAYRYWEELGLVRIYEQPLRIVYLNVRDTASALKKVKPGKYAKFSKDIQSVISGRMITTNEYNEYYLFLENTTFEPEALVAVAKYCAETKGGDINYPYILKVARSQMEKGANTLATVSDRLNSQQKYDADLKLVFKSLGSSRKFDHSDRMFYEKWSKEMGFTQDVIVNVAKNCKSGGMTKLDALLTEYYKRSAMSLKEIDEYEREKSRLFDIAKGVTRAIGVYYQNLDVVIEEYVVGWIQKGYDDETLLAVAKYCFKSGIRTLNGLAGVLDKLYKNGITTLASLEQYLFSIAQKDEIIQTVLAKAGLDRKVISNDRMLYKTWTENWEISQDAVMYAAELSAGTNAPLAYINRILSDCKNKGETTLEQIKNRKTADKTTASAAAKAIVGGKDMERRKYTDEQIAALFTALDETED